MKQSFAILLSVSVALVSAIGLLTSSASYTYQHPFAPGVKFAVDEGVVKREHKSFGGSSATPVAEVAVSAYDFGVMPPLTMGRHDFVVRNTGNAPLELAEGSTSCKCTLSDLTNPSILPGGESVVTVTWNSGKGAPVYSHYAVIETNDPRCPELTFRVRGRVAVQIGLYPEAIAFNRIEPDKPATGEALVYSQCWDEFSISGGGVATDGLQWHITPADAEVLAAHKAKSGYRLQVTTPVNLPRGDFHSRIRLSVDSPDSDELLSLDAVITGRVVGRIAVFGDRIDSDGVVDLGIVPRDAGGNASLVVKVRDEDTQLPVRSIQTVPEFMNVKLAPQGDNGLYRLGIEVPSGAPDCLFMGRPHGSIKIEFDHPRIRKLELKVLLGVAGT